MLEKITLLLAQVLLAWFLTPLVYMYIPVTAEIGLFLYAILLAVIVYLVGVIAGQVLRDIGTPGSGALFSSAVVALIFAGVVYKFPAALDALRTPFIAVGNPDGGVLVMGPSPTISYRGFLLVGALLGYWLRR